jgi:hypothetical protein
VLNRHQARLFVPFAPWATLARAGWHVDEQETWLAPVRIGRELLERFVEQRASPDNGVVVWTKKPMDMTFTLTAGHTD